MLRKLFLSFVIFFLPGATLFAADVDNINLRDIRIDSTNVKNTTLDAFIAPVSNFFFTAPTTGGDGLYLAFVNIAFQIKNFFIAIAIIFLIFGVLKLLFSQANEEDVAKWRNNIIWVSVGVFIMQISFGAWNSLILVNTSKEISGGFGYLFWTNIFLPIVKLLQMLASFGFIAMMLYAFYIIVTGGGDDEKLKKGKNTVIYALIGFFLIKIPETLIRMIYGRPVNKGDDCIGDSIFSYSTNCTIGKQSLSGTVGVIADIFNYFNTFLAILCVILVIYAGWLVLISGGDEEKLKKAKNIILYIILGFIVLVASHAIFRFFILTRV